VTADIGKPRQGCGFSFFGRQATNAQRDDDANPAAGDPALPRSHQLNHRCRYFADNFSMFDICTSSIDNCTMSIKPAQPHRRKDVWLVRRNVDPLTAPNRRRFPGLGNIGSIQYGTLLLIVRAPF
jgi:hypothetical protein